MALINGIFCGMDWFRKRYIVKFPRVDDETRDRIIDFISNTISDSIAKTAQEKMK